MTAIEESLVYIKMAESMGIKFMLDGQEVSSEEAFSPDGALPLFYLRAMRSADEFLDQQDLGFSFSKNESSLFGVYAHLPYGIAFASSRLLFTLDAITESMKFHLTDGNTIDLASLQSEVVDDLQSIIQSKPGLLS